MVPDGLVLAVDHSSTTLPQNSEPPDLAVLADAVEPEPVRRVLAVGESAAHESPGVSLPMASPVAVPRPKAALENQAPAVVDLRRVPMPVTATVLDLASPQVGLPAPSPRLAQNFRVQAQALRSVDIPESRLGKTSNGAEVLPTSAGNPVRPNLQPIAAPAIAGLVDYSPAAKRAMRPVPPPKVWFVPPAEPRITLPGPSLPRELNSLAEAGLRPVLESVRAPKRRRSGLGVVWTALAAVVVLAAAALYIVPPMLLTGKTAPIRADVTPESTPEATPGPGRPTPAIGTYPLSKTIEVTGFRFVVDLNGKSEIHYLVVNHSAALFGAVTVYVTLRDAAAKPGQAPIARFSFRAPDMGPYTSREMTSPIERISRPVTLPDWQDLHADVEIAE
jgi:hypothetical protein